MASLLIPEDRQEEEPDILVRLRRDERVGHFEAVRRRKDGSLLDISLTISPVKNLEGVIVCASKIARDITESKRIRTKLMESEARFPATGGCEEARRHRQDPTQRPHSLAEGNRSDLTISDRTCLLPRSKPTCLGSVHYRVPAWRLRKAERLRLCDSSATEG